MSEEPDPEWITDKDMKALVTITAKTIMVAVGHSIYRRDTHEDGWSGWRRLEK